MLVDFKRSCNSFWRRNGLRDIANHVSWQFWQDTHTCNKHRDRSMTVADLLAKTEEFDEKEKWCQPQLLFHLQWSGCTNEILMEASSPEAAISHPYEQKIKTWPTLHPGEKQGKLMIMLLSNVPFSEWNHSSDVHICHLSVVLPSIRNHICKCGCSKPELSTNALRLPLSFWNAICQSIDAQEEDGMNQGTEPTSKKKQKKRGPETYYTDGRSFLR